MLGVAASAFSALGLFILFRVSIELLGASTVGAWVMIQSVFFLSRVAEGGVGINLTRILALDRTSYGELSPRSYFLAGLLLVVGPVIVLGLLLIVPAEILLLRYFKVEIGPGIVRDLILLCYLNAVLSALASVGMSLVEGQGKLAWRHCGVIASTTIFIVGAYPVISVLGVTGLAMLYVAASAVTVVSSWIVLWYAPARSLSSRPIRIIVVNVWKDSLTASGMIVLRTSFEPWTKFLVGTFGGLTAVAALEFAFRVTTQLRVLIQSATQPLLFIGARSGASMTADMHSTYATAVCLVVEANWVGLALVSCSAPILSFLGFGYVSVQAIVFLLILAIGNSINSMGVIGYYAEASQGGFTKLLNIHFRMMAINVCLGALGGWVLGPVGAVLAYAVAFAYGGFALVRLWAYTSSSGVTKIVSNDRWLAAITAMSTVLSFGSVAAFPSTYELNVTVLLITATVSSVLALRFFGRWRHVIMG